MFSRENRYWKKTSTTSKPPPLLSFFEIIKFIFIWELLPQISIFDKKNPKRFVWEFQWCLEWRPRKIRRNTSTSGRFFLRSEKRRWPSLIYPQLEHKLINKSSNKKPSNKILFFSFFQNCFCWASRLLLRRLLLWGRRLWFDHLVPRSRKISGTKLCSLIRSMWELNRVSSSSI